MAVKPHPTGRLKIHRGDMVQVTTGKDVGRTGKVMEVIPAEGRLIVGAAVAECLVGVTRLEVKERNGHEDFGWADPLIGGLDPGAGVGR